MSLHQLTLRTHRTARYCDGAGLCAVVRGVKDRQRLANALGLKPRQRIALVQMVGHAAQPA